MSHKKQKTQEEISIDHAVALRRADRDEDQQWEIIRSLHRSGSAEISKRCIVMCESSDPAERQVAADILGQLGWRNGELPFREQSIPALRLLLNDKNDRVLDAAISALGHLRASDVILSHVHLAKHSSDLVRFSMACCLGLVDSAKARRVLIKLSADKDVDVRNWATFGLGSQCANNTKAIRAALFARVSDEDEETRNEAILGLARRKIPDAVQLVVRELELAPGNPSPLIFEAASELLAEEFIKPLLKVIEKSGDQNERALSIINQIMEKFGRSPE